MRYIWERKLSQRSGNEGPTHDPYSWHEYIVRWNGVTYTLRMGALGYARLYQGPTKIMEGYDRDGEADRIVQLWETLAGMSLRTFSRAYDHIHPYIEDPMPMWRYI